MMWLVFHLLLCAPLIDSFVIGGDGSDPVSNNVAYLHQLLSAVETQIQEMQHRIQQLETNMPKIQSESTRDPTVAFHVYLAKEVGAVQSAHMVYDTVLLNIGNAYSPLHGIFRAPYNGTYMFSVTAVNPPGQYIHCFLKKNDKTEEFIFAGGSEWDQNTRTTVLALNVNDDVWVEAVGYITGSLSDDGYGHIHMHSSFSGFLIKEM